MMGAVFSDNFFWFLVGLVIMVFWLNRPGLFTRDCRRLARLGRQFFGQITKNDNGAVFRGQYRGVPFTVSFFYSTSARMAISLEKKALFKMLVCSNRFKAEFEETAGERVLAQDARFDDKFFVFSRHRERVEPLLSNVRAREVVSQLLEDQFHYFKINGKSYSLERGYKPGRFPWRDCARWLALLEELVFLE